MGTPPSPWLHRHRHGYTAIAMGTPPSPVKGCNMGPMLETRGHWAVNFFIVPHPIVTRNICLIIAEDLWNLHRLPNQFGRRIGIAFFNDFCRGIYSNTHIWDSNTQLSTRQGGPRSCEWYTHIQYDLFNTLKFESFILILNYLAYIFAYTWWIAWLWCMNVDSL